MKLLFNRSNLILASADSLFAGSFDSMAWGLLNFKTGYNPKAGMTFRKQLAQSRSFSAYCEAYDC